MRGILLLLLIASASNAQPVFRNLSGILNSVQPDSIRSHIAYLADDKLMGRKPGTEGYQMAMDYVVKHFKQFGLQPAGENGTYFQEVKIRTARINAEKCSMKFSTIDKQLTFGADFVVLPNFETTSVLVTAPLVFAGYGIHAPEFGYDDYEA